jgi:hypothetical protein
MNLVKLKKTTIVTVEAARISTLTATLDDGTPLNITGPASVGDWAVKDEQGVVSILSDATFQTEQVTE